MGELLQETGQRSANVAPVTAEDETELATEATHQTPGDGACQEIAGAQAVLELRQKAASNT